MTENVFPSLRTVFRGCRIYMLVFGGFCLLSALSSVCLSTSGLLLFAVLVSGIVCAIRVLVFCVTNFYRAVKNIPENTRILNAFAGSVGACFFILFLCVSLFLSCLLLFMIRTEPIAVSESDFTAFYGQENARAMQDFLTAFSAQGYTSPLFLFSSYATCMFDLLSFLTLIFSALCFSVLSRSHPLVSAFAGGFLLRFIGSILTGVVNALIYVVAPGIAGISGQIVSLYPINQESVIEYYGRLAQNLPDSMLISRMMALSSLCTLLNLFTFALIGCRVPAAMSKRKTSV